MSDIQSTMPPDPILEISAEDTGTTPAKMAPRWVAILGVLAVGVIYAVLPSRLTLGPNWLPLALECLVLLPLVVAGLMGRRLPFRVHRTLALVLLGLVTAALAIAIALLIQTLPTNRQAGTLLRSAALVWACNVLVFSLWYWEVDGGGPVKRFHAGHEAADFMFPQQAGGNVSNWVPHYLDYLFLAFTGATALSPADTYPLTRRAKSLMMIEGLLSLIVLVLLAARAVNIL